MLEDILEQTQHAVAENWGTIVGSMVVLTVPHSTRMYAMMGLHGIKKALGKEKRIYIDDNYSDERYDEFITDFQKKEPEIQVYIPAFDEPDEVLAEVVRSSREQEYSNKKIVLVTSSKDKARSKHFEGKQRSGTYIAAEMLARSYQDVMHIHVPGYENSLYGRINPEVSKFLNKQNNPGPFKRFIGKFSGRKEDNSRSLGISTKSLDSVLEKIADEESTSRMINALNFFGDGRKVASYNTLASAFYRASEGGMTLPQNTGTGLEDVVNLYHTTYFDKEKGRLRRLTNKEVAQVIDDKLRKDSYRGKQVSTRAITQMLHAAEKEGYNVEWKKGWKHPKTPWDNYFDFLASSDRKLDMGWVEKLSKGELPPRMKPGDIDYAMVALNGKKSRTQPDGKKTLITILDAEDTIVEKDAFRKFNWSINHEKYDAVQGRLLFAKNPFSFLGFHAAADYSVLFRRLAPDTVAAGFPLTLSGTSYALARDSFYSIGILDPYNQTEDAMAGMILSANRSKVGLVKTHTLEEAPTDMFGVEGDLSQRLRNWNGGWLAQRRRWAYGFGQSILSVWKSNNFNLTDKLKMSYLLLYSPTYSSINMAIMPMAVASLGIDLMTDWQVPGWVLYPSVFTTGAGAVQIGCALDGAIYSAKKAGYNIDFNKKIQMGLMAPTQVAYWFLQGVPPTAAAMKILDNNFGWSVTAHKGIPLVEQIAPELITQSSVAGR